MTVRLRAAGPGDAEFAYRVREAAFRSYVEQLGPWDEAGQRRDHERRFAEQEFLVVERDGRRVGIVALQMRPDGLRLNQLMIHPDHQGRGTGAAVMEVLFARADTAGLPVRLRVLRVNPRAATFYGRLGFRVVGGDVTHQWMERDAAGTG